jgi:hypothetical protein
MKEEWGNRQDRRSSVLLLTHNMSANGGGYEG